MERRSLYEITRALSEAEVRFLITGGLAVVAHGYVRFTANVDLLIGTGPDEWQRAVRALGELGYEASSERQEVVSMLELRSPRHARTPVVLVAAPAIDFERAYHDCLTMEASTDVRLRFVSKPDLLASKRSLIRALDAVDVEKLEWLPDANEHLPRLAEIEWPVGWEGHERDQLGRTARLPLWSKLEWLEEAQALAEHLQRRRLGGPLS